MKDIHKSPLAWMMILCLLIPALTLAAQKPRIWVTNDLQKGPAGDEDDDVCMGVLLLLADHYSIEGISVNANPHYVKGTDRWARDTFIADYQTEVGRLNAYYNHQYQTDVAIHMASTAGKRFKDIHTEAVAPHYLDKNPAIKGLIQAADQGPLFVLNWGPLTEVAMVFKYCIDRDKEDTLKNIIVISHWTQRGGPWNCAADNDGCNYVHDQAEANPNIVMIELGPSGQRGLVENISKESATLDHEIMFASKIGKHLGAKWLKPTCWSPNCIGMPDMSDGSTMLVLLGFGGGIEAYRGDGKVVDQNKMNILLCQDRAQIFAKLEERALVASGKLTK